MGISGEAMAGRPAYRLFDSNTVAVAAFLCSPLAGVILIAVNYVRLRKQGKAVAAVILGVVATAIPVGIKLIWETTAGSVAAISVGLLLFLCTWQIAHEVQGEDVEEHIARGGRLGRGATAFFVGIATVLGVYGVTRGAVYGVQHRGVVVVGSRDRVVYSGLATKGTAAAVGDALRGEHFFKDTGATVFVEKGLGSRTISFAVPDGVWNEVGVMGNFEEVARAAAPAMGGLPVEVKLLDGNEQEEAASTVGKADFGDDNVVYYEGQVTRDEAEALGEQMQAEGAMQGKGANAFLMRHSGEGTTVSFVVGKDGWKDEKRVTQLEAVVRNAAPVLGGFPIEMHLVNCQLDVEKNELIEQE